MTAGPDSRFRNTVYDDPDRLDHPAAIHVMNIDRPPNAFQHRQRQTPAQVLSKFLKSHE